MEPEIEKTISRLEKKTRTFHPDPIAGENFSRIASIVSSSYQRHGFILERAVFEQLKLCPRFKVWADPSFQVTGNADQIVSASLTDPSAIDGVNHSYNIGERILKIDALVFDTDTKRLGAYKIKRATFTADSGKKRQMLQDLLCSKILLKSYGDKLDLNPETIESRIIFYYGECSLPKPYALTGEELDEHFGWDIRGPVEEVNELFQQRLFALLGSNEVSP